MHFTTETERTRSAGRPRVEQGGMPAWFAPLPGVAVCLLGTLVAAWLSGLVPAVPLLPMAILLGAVVANAARLPAELRPGIDFAAQHLLRAGVVLLGLQIVLSDVVDLGWRMLLTVLAVVAGGAIFAIWLRRRVGVGERLTLVAVLGAVAIGLIPDLGALLGLPPGATGVWAEVVIHEVAPVLAVAAQARSVLLTMAMFALGCGVSVAQLRTAGWRPVMLGAAVIGLAGVVAAF